MLKFAVLLTAIFSVSLAQNAEVDVCTQPKDSGVCYAMFLAFYYDSSVHECLLFVYGGCGGNGNRFETEAECYSVCKEKLVQLHPPKNVTVAFTQSNRIYLYWYPPTNYKFHEPNIDNGTSNNLTYTVNGTSSNDGTQLATVPLSGNLKDLSKPIDESTNDNTEKGSKVTTERPNNTTATVDSTKTTNTGNNATDDKAKMGEVNGTATPATTGTTKEVDIIAGTNLSADDYIGKDKVPFHLARLKQYVITIKLSTGQFIKNVSVPGNETEKSITGLSPSKEYDIIVSAIYQTTTMSAKVVKATTTADPSIASNCLCDPFGTETGSQSCNMSLSQAPWCKCKPRYAGLFCEICAHGFYRTARSMPCHSCPCPKTFSTGSCHFFEGYLHCTTCKEGYAGNLCHRCDNGYYRDHLTAPSKCVKCNVCHNVKPGLICDPFTGKCLNCHYNTTGDKCDRCLEGFEGDPLNNISCKPIAKLHKAAHSPAVGVIAAIVVGTIVLLSGIVGFIVYKRSHNFPKNKPFWTIEFKEDHEDVNFSAVPEDELERQHEDMSYYENQSKGKSKLPYSQLKEDI